MHGVLQVALANAALAALLAVVVWCVTRVVRRPAVAHVLWLLVLVKLVTPPFVSVPLPFVRAPAPTEPERPVPVAWQRDPAGPRFEAVADERPEPAGVVEAPPAEEPPPQPEPGRPFSWVWVIAGCWAAGSLVLAVCAVVRIRRFHRALSLAVPATGRVADVAAQTATRLGLGRCPTVLLTDARVPPMVWPVGRARLVLPRGLADGLDDERLALVLGHELAHVRRGDHVVRWFELLVLTLFWWHPVVWWAGRQVATAADHCCDALVLSLSGQGGRAYAETLLAAADFLAGDSLAPLPAAGLGTGSSLRRRCAMVLGGKTSSRLGWPGVVVVLALAALVPVSFYLREPERPGRAGDTETEMLDVTALGEIVDRLQNPFRIQPYLRAAAQIQAMDEKDRVKLLRDWAKDGEHDEQVIVLCRMLFEARDGGTFRAPRLGAPAFFGDTSSADWPLEPIAVFEDVPIVIVRGYTLAGEAEPAQAYLEYCLTSCRWTSRVFGEIPDRELEKRLDRFVRSAVWKRPLKTDEIAFFTMQGFFLEDYARYVTVGTIDPKRAEHVIALLNGQGIPNLVEGSVAYGVSVPPWEARRALALLEADVAKHGYWAELATPEKVKEQIESKSIVRTGVRPFREGAEWKEARAAAAATLDSFLRRHGRPVRLPPGWKGPAPQYAPPTHEVFLELKDGTRIEYELTDGMSFVRRREGPRGKLARDRVSDWDFLNCEPPALREQAVKLIADLLARDKGSRLLEDIRPHLRPGVGYRDLVGAIGEEDMDAGDSILRPVYFLGGKHRGMSLVLEFDGLHLKSAYVFDPERQKVFEHVLLAQGDPVRQNARPITTAEVVLALYTQGGRREVSDGPPIIAVVWGDGQAVWSKDRLHGGAPYLSGRVDPTKLTALVAALERDEVFTDRRLTHVRFGPDAEYTTMLLRSGKRQLKMQSWHELSEEGGRLVATSRGLEALGGRDRADVLKKDDADYRHFRRVWDRARAGTAALIPKEGTPVDGKGVMKEGELSWQP